MTNPNNVTNLLLITLLGFIVWAAWRGMHLYKMRRVVFATIQEEKKQRINKILARYEAFKKEQAKTKRLHPKGRVKMRAIH